MKSFLRIFSMAVIGLALAAHPEMAHAKKRKDAKKAQAAAEEKKEEVKTPADEGAAKGAASEKKAPAYAKMPYGMAGCGLGSLIFKNQENKGMQILAAIFNDLALSQSFAISSGTSNCVQTSEHMAATEQSVFMNVNLTAVSREAAQGSGRHLEALAEVFGCDNHGAFATISQDSYDAIFTSSDAEVVLGNYRQTLRSQEKLVGQCARLI